MAPDQQRTANALRSIRGTKAESPPAQRRRVERSQVRCALTMKINHPFAGQTPIARRSRILHSQ